MVRQVLGDETVEPLDGELCQAANEIVQLPFLLDEVGRVEVVPQLDGACPAIRRKQSGGRTKEGMQLS